MKIDKEILQAIKNENLYHILHDIHYCEHYLISYFNEKKYRHTTLLIGMFPYFSMIYYSAKNFFKNNKVSILVKDKDILQDFEDAILDDVRSADIKLYKDKNSWNKNDKHIDELINKDLYLCLDMINNHICSESHLKFFKQVDLNYNVNRIGERLAYKVMLTANLSKDFFIELRNLNFNFSIETKQTYKRFTAIDIALIDVLASLNFYNEFLKFNVIDKFVDFKIKYVLFVNSFSSIKRLIADMDNETFSKRFNVIIKECDDAIKNSIYTICVHGDWFHYDKLSERELQLIQELDLNKELYTQILQFLSGKDFDEFNDVIQILIIQLIEILEEYIMNNIF